MFFFRKMNMTFNPCSEFHGKLIESSFNEFGEKKIFSQFFFNIFTKIRFSQKITTF